VIRSRDCRLFISVGIMLIATPYMIKLAMKKGFTSPSDAFTAWNVDTYLFFELLFLMRWR
jgi:hypothetical protein